MNRRILLGTLAALITIASGALGFERKVLYEELTAYWCGPCAAAAPIFSGFITNPDYADDVTAIVVHDDGDPWSNLVPGLHNTRVTYYNLTGWPTCWVDGTHSFNPNSAGAYSAYFNSRRAIESPIQIELDARILQDRITVSGTITSGDEAITGTTHKLRIALINLHWEHYTGTNGLSEWHYGLMYMHPNATGQEFTIDANSTADISAEFQWPVSLQNIEVEYDNVKVVAFVQNDANREVLQSEWVFPRIEYGVNLSSPAEATLIDAESEKTLELDITNLGYNEDTFSITMDGEWDNTWNITFTTPDGEQTETGTVTLTDSESYTSSVRIVAPAGSEGTTLPIEFTVESQAADYAVDQFTLNAVVNNDILVIHADGENDHSALYTAALDAMEDASYVLWNFPLNALPIDDLDEMSQNTIIWANGSLTEMEETATTGLNDCLAAGCNLLLSGSTVANVISSSELMTSMGASYEGINLSATTVEGITDDPVGDGLNFGIRMGDGANNVGIPRELGATDGTIFANYARTDQGSGVYKATDTFKSVLLGFPFETINAADDRAAVMDKLVTFLTTEESGVANTSSGLPVEFSLQQNYPNPFNPATTIGFTLPMRADVTVTVTNVVGQEVMSINGGSFAAGLHNIQLDGSKLSSGVYFYTLTANGKTRSFQQTRKMMLMK